MGGFWKGKRVFITGHTGFKGAWLTAVLLGKGAEVTGYALAPPTSPSLFDLIGLADRIVHIEGDVRDRNHVNTAICEAQPDIVFHLAAQALVRESYDDPLGTFDTNMTGTMNVLEAIRYTDSVRSIVVATTDKCYLNHDTGCFFAEDAPLGGKDPYSASKAAAEIVALAYYESFLKAQNKPLATARAGNVIGGGDWAKDRLIPDVARAAQAEQPVLIRNPAATRPWQHVLEPLRGYMMLAERLYTDGHSFSGGWNFGPASTGIRSVADVLSTLSKTLPFDLQIDTASQPHEARTLALDIRKAQEKLGWHPWLDLESALRLTGEWYSAFAQNKPIAALTLEQMNQYWERG